MSAAAYLVGGEDPVLRDEVVDQLIAELVGDEDRSLVVEDVTVPGRATDGDPETPGGAEGRGLAVSSAVNALQSPPFMTAVRVVVLRDAGNLTKDDAAPLSAYLADPLDTSSLVLITGGSRLPADLTKALKAAKAVEMGPASERTDAVLSRHLMDARLELSPDALAVVVDHLGEDAGRVPRMVELLGSAFGPGTSLDVDDVRPYLGEVGSVPGYQLTNAIERGDVPGALEVLHRMLVASGPRQGRPMHPLQVLGLLHSYYRRLARLDDPEVRNSKDAVAALGGRIKEYPARKALEQSRALRADGVRLAFDHLFTADLELKGSRAIPEEAVLEVLVARLAALSGRARGRTRTGARPSRASR